MFFAGFACNFENSALCGMTQSTDDNFDWIRHMGQTPSRATGPSRDHTEALAGAGKLLKFFIDRYAY